VGPVRIAAGSRGIVAIAMLSSEEAFAADLDRRRLGAPVAIAAAAPGPARALAEHTVVRLEATLAGTDVQLDDLPIDVRDRSAWDRLVLDGVRSIPRGEVASYGEVARRIGRAGAARPSAARSPATRSGCSCRATGSSRATARSAVTGSRRGAAARRRSRSSVACSRWRASTSLTVSAR